MTQPVPKIAGAIIAGGKSSRMQQDGVAGDKFLLPLGKQPIIAHVAERLLAQLDTVFINANREMPILDTLPCDVVRDSFSACGPLAGILAAIQAAQDHQFLVTVAADTPFFPADLVARLVARQAETQVPIILAQSNARLHPLFGLWRTDLAGAFNRWLESSASKSVLAFAMHIGFESAVFPLLQLGEETYDPFFNINHRADYIEAQRLQKVMT